MFRFKELTVKDWCQHTARKEAFVAGTNGVIGTNGRGKSNLVAALFTAITGRTLAEDVMQANINFEADKAIVQADFVYNGVDGYVKRTFNAPRIDGKADNRKDMTSTAELQFGADKLIKGTAKVTTELSRITGMSPRVVEDHIFISQDKLRALLFQTKADRLKSFLSLIPGVEKAEALRLTLQNELNRYPEMLLAQASDVIRKQLEALVLECDTLIAELQLTDDELKTLDLKSSVNTLNAVREALVANAQVVQLDAKLKTLEDMTGQMTVDQVAADKVLTDILQAMETKKSMAELARSELHALEQARNIWQTRQSTEAEISRLLTAIDEQREPDDNGKPWVKLPELAAERELVTQRIAESRKAMLLLTKGDVCPTCGKPFENAAAERQKHTRLLADDEPKERMLRAEIDKLAQAQAAYNTAVSASVRWVETTSARLESLNKTLADLPSVVEPTPERVKQLTAMVTDYDTLCKNMIPAETKSKQLALTLASYTSQLLTIRDQRDKLQATADNMPDPSKVKAAEDVQQRHNMLYARSNELNGRITAKREELTRVKEALLNAEIIESQAGAVKDYRGLLTEVRDTLHREKLPQEVLTTYVQQLDTLCNKYLDTFGNPFAVSLDREMEMTCFFPNGYACNTVRLSGGQKCVLSVAMRFAINELFARDLGLLVLDEPSEFMDDTNIGYLGELMMQIQRMGKESGVQTIVITHAQALIPCFERVILVQ